MTDYDDFQNKLRSREFCIGWRQENSHNIFRSDVLYDSWHEAQAVAAGACSPGYIPFVEPALFTMTCPHCGGTGSADVVGKDYDCTQCHGKGRVRA